MKFLTAILVAGLALSGLAGDHETSPNSRDGDGNHHDRDHHDDGGHNGHDGDRHHGDGGRPGHGHPKPPKPPGHGAKPPAAPTQLTAEAVSEFQVNLNWLDAATNELGFKIERSHDGTNYSQIAELQPNVTSYRDTGRFPDTKYFYRARAFNNAGNSAYSNVARTQTFAPACELSICEGHSYALALVPPEASPFAAIAVGDHHGLALKTDGTVTGWSLDYLNRAEPPPPNLTGVIAIAAGGEHSLVLRSNGTVVAWGNAATVNAPGAGNPPSNLSGVVAIATGSSHSLALKTNGTVVGWGYNDPAAAIPPVDLKGVVAVAAGGYHSLALKSDGTVVGWGFNDYDQATPPADLTNAVAIAAGTFHNLALRKDGTVVGWGSSWSGATTAPTNLTGVTAIAAGDEFSVALRGDGTVVTWGYAPFDGSYLASPLAGVAAITAGGPQFLALTTAPNPPAIIGLSVLATNRIVVAWRDNSAGHNRFNIERAPLAGNSDIGEWQHIGAVGIGETSFVDTTVTANAAYAYRVRAENECYGSKPSQLRVVTVTPPMQPPYLSASAYVDQARLIGFSFEGGVTGYELERAPDLDGNPGVWSVLWTTNFSYLSDSFSYTDAGLALNNTYWYRMRVVNGLGGSPYSPPVSVTIVPPGSPSNLSARIGAAHQVNLTWSAANPYDQDGFRVERSTDTPGANETWTEIATVTNNIYFGVFTDTPVIPDTTYRYRLRAFNSLGISLPSPEAVIRIVAPTAPILGATVFANNIRLNWYNGDYPGDLTQFKLERANDASGSPGTWIELATIANPDNSYYHEYTDGGRALDKTYWYRVRAINWVGTSPFSPPVSATIVRPASPIGLTARISTNGVNLTWQPAYPYDQSGFTIEHAPETNGAAGTWTKIAAIPATNYSYMVYNDTHVIAVTANWYRVRAFNFLGVSTNSDPVRIELLPPPTPTQFSAQPFANQINLAWNNYSYLDMYGVVDGFKVERAPDAAGTPGTWSPLATLNDPNRGNYADTNLTVNTTYWYRVQAFNWLGLSPPSQALSATILPPAVPPAPSPRIGLTNEVILELFASPPIDQDGFKVERADDASGSPGTWSEIGTVAAANSYNFFYSDTNVTALTTNWYRTRTFNVLGVSAASLPTRIQIVPPNALNSLNATPFANQVALGWDMNYAGYGQVDVTEIQRANDVGGTPGTWTPIGTNYNGYNNFTDKGLATDTYWYRVRTANWVGASPVSDTVRVTISPPAAPGNLSATVGTTNRVELTWNTGWPYDQDGIYVERAPDADGVPGGWSKIATVPAKNDYPGSYTDSHVTANTTNWYRVRSFNIVGVSGPSTPLQARIIPPPAPQYLAASPFADQVQLNWYGTYYNYGLIQGSEIERAEDVAGSPGTWSQIGRVDGYGNSYADIGRPANSTWWYRVRPYNWVGPGEFSAAVSDRIIPPKAPENLSALIGATNRVEINWNAPGDQSGFYLERAPAAGDVPGTWSQIANIPATNTYYGSYTDTNITAFSTNWYRVRAYNVVGVSPYSPTTHIGITPPDAPAYLSAAAFANRINLSWSSYFYGYGEVTGYKLERAMDAGGSPGVWTQIAILPGIYSSSYTDTNRPAGSTFWYRVHAYNWIGDGTRTPPAKATIIPPAAPNNLTSTIGTTNTVNLFWYAGNPQDQDIFKVEWASDTNGIPGPWTEIAIVPATNNYYGSFADTNVLANNTNWYRVSAFNRVGVSAYSPLLKARIIPPPAPQSLTASPLADQVQLTWYGDYYGYGLIQGFEIQRAEDIGGSPGTWSRIDTMNSGDNHASYTDTGRPVNSTWWYRVRAHNWIGPGEFSAATSATITPPQAPYNLNTVIGSSNRVEVNWYAGSPADQNGFYLERATDAGGVPGTWSQIATIPATNTYYGSYTDTHITAFTTNWYRIRAYNLLGVSSYSETAHIAIVPPGTPGYLNATTFANQVRLSWDSYFYGYGEVAGYKLERAPDASGSPGVWTQIAKLTGLYPNYYTDTNLPASSIFWYRVHAYNWIGDGTRTPPAKATIIPPAAPNNLTSTIGTTNTVNLFWYAGNPQDQDFFKVEWAPDTNGVPGTWTEIATVPATNNYGAAFAHTNVLAYTTNWYRVRAFNLVGVSDYSLPVSARTLPPPAPFYLNAYPYENQITLYWSVDSTYGILGSKLERAPDLGGAPGPWTQIAKLTEPYGSYNDLGLTTDGTYWYRVRVYNWVGDSPYTSPTSATISWYDSPPAVTSILVNDGGLNITSLVLTNNDVLITWSTMANTTNIVEASSNLADDFSEVSPRMIIGGNGKTVTSYRDVGALTNSASRFYRIRVVP